MGHVRDRWSVRDPQTGRKRRGPRWGKGMRWQARWIDAGGIERTVMCATESEARDLVAAAHINPLLGAKPKPVDFEKWARKWQAAQVQHMPSTAESTEVVLKVRVLPQFDGLTLDQVTRARVREAVVAWNAKYAPSTVRATFSVLHSVLEAAVGDGLIPANPCAGVKLPATVSGRLLILTTEQVLAIRDRMTPVARSMVVVAAASGLRSGELRGLRVGRAGRVLQVVEQVDPTGGMGPPKSKHGFRSIDIGEHAWAVLEPELEGRGPDEFVWPARGGGALSRTTQMDRWRLATKGMGFPKGTGWHALRHYHASLLISAGLSPVAVAARMGNTVRETMETYAHLWPSDEDRMVAAVDAELGPVLGPSGDREGSG